ncbi:MAG: aminotransferase class III-fold pyridoxal phosphate-dependent enzyme, partial [Campylobacter hyointestinalis]
MQNYARVGLGFKCGKGSVLWDLNGEDYIDFASGIGVCSLGHAHKKLAKTISKQAHTLLHNTNKYKKKQHKNLEKKKNYGQETPQIQN